MCMNIICLSRIAKLVDKMFPVHIFMPTTAASLQNTADRAGLWIQVQ